ncbi:MAG TPA: DUF2520 domain-containing protein [Kofleriaceae bacterium]|nr:DUF2520 domain-containing protein [Kofleriaceae bacterium]
MTRSPTPNMFVVGAGPVATALAGGLRLAGVPVLGLWARKPAAARAAAAAAGVAAFSPAPPDLLLEADLIIVAVRDDAVREVAQRLVATGLVGSRHVLLHCSGAAAAAEAFAPVAGKVGGMGTLHPLRAVADARTAMRNWKGTVFGVEGDARGLTAATQVAQLLGGTALPLEGGAMARYHAAAAIASNYVVAVIDAAVGLLRQAGVDEAAAVAALVPLAQGALANVAERGLAQGLTGPIRRGDAGTVARHLEALDGEPALQELYRVLGRRALGLARAAGAATPEDLAAIKALLTDRIVEAETAGTS